MKFPQKYEEIGQRSATATRTWTIYDHWPSFPKFPIIMRENPRKITLLHQLSLHKKDIVYYTQGYGSTWNMTKWLTISPIVGSTTCKVSFDNAVCCFVLS